MTSNLPLTQEAGGFLQPSLVSQNPENGVHSNTTSILPQQRLNPLKPGSKKESGFIEYVDQKLLGVSRRYEKRFNSRLNTENSQDTEGRGYEGFEEVARDLETVVDVVWVSGTPSLQTPYLLTIALAVSSYLSSFSFSPPPTFQLLHKLDLAFSSLLQGTSVETGIPLPGFDGSRNKLSTTEKVRMRGLVERTRVAVVDVAGREESMMHDTSEVQSLTETDDDSLNEDADSIDWDHIDGGHGRWEMEIARVYEKTIEELGTSLDGTNLRAL